jgi:hypothetical protein
MTWSPYTMPMFRHWPRASEASANSCALASAIASSCVDIESSSSATSFYLRDLSKSRRYISVDPTRIVTALPAFALILMARVSCSTEDDDITAQMAQRHEDAVKRLHDSIAQVSIGRGDLKFPPVRDHGVGSRATLASSTRMRNG